MAEQNPPPLPMEEVPPPLPPEPPLPQEVSKPPMPMHMSNQKHEWLDFDRGDGDQSVRQTFADAGVPAAKRPRLEGSVTECELEPSEQDLSKNLAMNIEVANAMLAAIANEIKIEEDSPRSVEDGEVLSDNEPGMLTRHDVIKLEQVTPPLDADAQVVHVPAPTSIKSEPVEQHVQSQKSNESMKLMGVNVNVNVSNLQVTIDSQSNEYSAGSENITNAPKATESVNVSPVTEPSTNPITQQGNSGDHNMVQHDDPQQQQDNSDRIDNEEMQEAGIIPGSNRDEYGEDPLQRQFCPFDVGSQRKPVSQIPVAPPATERKYK